MTIGSSSEPKCFGEGHQSQSVLSWDGRQVHVDRRRLELPALRRQPAILLAQLEYAETIQGRRFEAVDAYRSGLETWAISNGVRSADATRRMRSSGAPVLPADARPG